MTWEVRMEGCYELNYKAKEQFTLNFVIINIVKCPSIRYDEPVLI